MTSEAVTPTGDCKWTQILPPFLRLGGTRDVLPGGTVESGGRAPVSLEGS